MQATILRARRLPLAGRVLVRPAQRVAADDPVAETELPGRAVPLPLAGLLGCEPAEVQRFLLVRPGEAVRNGQALALRPGVWGIGRRAVCAPEDGTVEGFWPRSGQLLLRGLPVALCLQAHVPGVVTRLFPGHGCEVRAWGAWVQGVFGVGGEVRGRIRLMNGSAQPGGGTGDLAAPGAPVDAGGLRGAVCVAAAASEADVAGWAAAGASATVVGGMGYRALTAIRARYPRLAVVLTEGFGPLPMAPRTWAVLSAHEGAVACVDGTTQIRAGVVRPEVIVPLSEGAGPAALAPRTARGGQRECRVAADGVGMRVRIVRAPDFGRTGVVRQRPAGPRAIATEAVLPVLFVRHDGGGTTVVPQANVEPVE